MVLKYYFDIMSQPCRVLQIFLKAAKIPYEACPVALRKGEHFTEEFQKINPLKKLPVIVHNNKRLTESVGIVRYLTREFPVADHWYPKDSLSQAKVDEFLEWQHLNIRLFGSMVFMHKILFPITKQEPVNEEEIKKNLKYLHSTLISMEKMFLTETKFLNQNELSIADVFGACELEQPISAGYDVLKDHPRVQEWLDQVKEKLQPHYDEAHAFNNKLRQKMISSNL